MKTGTRGRNPKLLDLTKEGRNALEAKGYRVKRTARGGAEHRWWQKKVQDHYEEKGYDSFIEYYIDSRSIDVYSIKGDEEMATEIALSPEHEVENVKKCLEKDFDKIQVVCRSEGIREKIKGDLKSELGETPEEILFSEAKAFLKVRLSKGAISDFILLSISREKKRKEQKEDRNVGKKMGKIPKGATKNLKNPRSAFQTLLSKLGSGRDIEMHAIQPRGKSKYFRAEPDGDRIKVSRARNHRSADITSERTVTVDQFECVAERYNDYVRRKTGVRREMRDSCGQNTSYIISIIHELL